MPNGHDKNWVRLRAAIDGFYLRHVRWPDRVRVRPAVIANLRTELFSEEAFSKFVARLVMVPDEQGTIIVEDDAGPYNCGTDGFAPGRPSFDVAGWLRFAGVPLSRQSRVPTHHAEARGMISRFSGLGSTRRVLVTSRRCSAGRAAELIDRRASRIEWPLGDLVRLRAKTIAGSLFLLAGALVVADGLVSGPHAFGFGWYSVAGIVLAGLLLLLAGASTLRETGRPVSRGDAADPPSAGR